MNLPSLLPEDCDSPICREWPLCPPQFLETSMILRKLHHKWRVSYKDMLKIFKTLKYLKIITWISLQYFYLIMNYIFSVINIGKYSTKHLEIEWEKKSQQVLYSKIEKLHILEGKQICKLKSFVDFLYLTLSHWKFLYLE